MNTTENNKLIAEFMGLTVERDRYNRAGFKIPEHSRLVGIEGNSESSDFYQLKHFGIESKYHTSWDWLMPVVKKIKTWYYKSPRDNYYKFTDACGGIEQFKNNLFQVEIELTYKAVVEFIKYYNENKEN